MINPQEPNPAIFWCRKCQCHGDFVVQKKSASDSQGTSTWEIKCCNICTAEGGEPRELKKGLMFSAMVFGGVILFIDAFILAMGYKMGLHTDPYIMIFLASGSFFLFAQLWFAPRIGDILCYLKWKKWAKERGWE